MHGLSSLLVVSRAYKGAQQADRKRVECMAFLARVLPLTRAGSKDDARQWTSPTGRHYDDSKLTEACTQARCMKPALSQNADAPIGATAAVLTSEFLGENQRKNRII
jgi:hypothetical protein